MIQWTIKDVLSWKSIWLYPYSAMDNRVYNAKIQYLWKKYPKYNYNRRIKHTNKLFGIF